ncbi:MAG: hypothetical protein ACYS22_16055 [Planctomycetota bacterium]|jgi:hypothetical protein
MARVDVFCPFCNAKGGTQPILSPMTCVYIMQKNKGADSTTPPPAKGPGSHRRTAHFEYRCGRCGYTEIHERMLGEAA